MKKAPLALVKERFGEKSKLVEAVRALATEELWLGRTSADRGGDKGLDHVSNAKLIRLHDTLSQVKADFGSRAKLIDAICELEKRGKDEGYKKRLGAWPVPRLYDSYKAAKKRADRAAKLASLKKA
jgi:hypothetical protein